MAWRRSGVRFSLAPPRNPRSFAWGFFAPGPAIVRLRRPVRFGSISSVCEERGSQRSSVSYKVVLLDRPGVGRESQHTFRRTKHDRVEASHVRSPCTDVARFRSGGADRGACCATSPRKSIQRLGRRFCQRQPATTDRPRIRSERSSVSATFSTCCSVRARAFHFPTSQR